MKKLLLLSALALGTIALNAQSLTVRVMGNEVANGSTVDAYCLTPNADIPMLHILDPEVEACPSVTGNYSITVTNLATTSNFGDQMVNMQFCWPTNCMIIMPGMSLTQEGTLEAGVFKNLRIDTTNWSGDIDEVFTIPAKVEIVEKGNASNTFTVTINMIHDPNAQNGIDGVYDNDETSAEYFDLFGRRIANPEKGQIVIERKGAKTVKTIF